MDCFPLPPFHVRLSFFFPFFCCALVEISPSFSKRIRVSRSLSVFEPSFLSFFPPLMESQTGSAPSFPLLSLRRWFFFPLFSPFLCPNFALLFFLSWYIRGFRCPLSLFPVFFFFFSFLFFYQDVPILQVLSLPLPEDVMTPFS